MGYDIFSQPQGPQIPISLFGDAAQAGTRVGTEIPSPISAGIQGITKGVQVGQELALNQAKVDAIPAQQAMLEAQVKNEQAVASMNELKAQIATLDQDTQLKIQDQELKNQLLSAQQANKDFTNMQKIDSLLGINDPHVQASILEDPELYGTILKNPKLADQLVGIFGTNPYANPLKVKQIQNAISFTKQRELDIQQEKVTAAATKGAQAAIEKAYNDVVYDPHLPPEIKSWTQKQLHSDIKMYPAGTKQVDKDTGMINEAAADKPLDPLQPEMFDVFIKGKKISTVKDSKAAQRLNLFQGLYSRAYLPPPAAEETKTTTPEDTQTATNPPRVKSLEDIAKEEAGLGFPESKGLALLQDARNAGQNAGTIEQFGNRIGLGATPIERASVSNINATPQVQELRNDIQAAANNSAEKIMSDFQNGSADEKQQLRDWAKANGISLTASSLKNYFVNSLETKLGSDYQTAYQRGIESQSSQLGKDAAVSQAQDERLNSLKGKTPEQALTIARQAKTLADTSLKTGEVAKQNNLSPNQTQKLSATTDKISTNKFLADKPAYVKAIAAVESGGNPDAVSGTGVKGLMQVTQAVAGKYGLNRNIPEENVLAGQMYIEDLIRDFQGNRDLAYAAYNAGPPVIRYAQRLANGSDDWSDIKPYMYEALSQFVSSFKLPNETKEQAINRKLKEVYNYPEKVRMHEEIYS